MAESSYTGASGVIRRTDWPATWAGVFTFVAISSIFEMLGMAIFANANATPANGMNMGMVIWTIVLTIVAMYVAGRETGHLAVLADRGDAVIHGMTMFGLSVVAVLVLAALASGAGTNSLSTYMRHLSSAALWTGFLSLFLGWLAARGGAASAGVGKTKPALENVRDIRPAA